ncbi:DNA repair protein RecO [Enteractinococcus helveticum]|uniref:DNA repair protein RecO n=1 Tax=Enteractinococcus helveticum TaxID=1837282 RepID=UPI0005C2F07B|nr:DNA repair protein RecO [Enteractinococcus helveticum]
MSQSYRTHGIVLRTYKLAEADRIIVILTADHGQIRAVAKGVRRTTSKFGSTLEPFMHTRLQLVPRRNMHMIVQTETIHPYGMMLTNDYDSFGAASAMVETAEQLTRDEDITGASQQYRLLHGAIAALARRAASPIMLLTSYLLRALAIAGWAPTFDECSKCGVEGRHNWLSVPLGGVVCDDCAPPQTPYATDDVVALLAALLAGDWKVVSQAEPAQTRQATSFVAQYLQYHLEKTLQSLSVMDQG